LRLFILKNLFWLGLLLLFAGCRETVELTATSVITPGLTNTVKKSPLPSHGVMSDTPIAPDLPSPTSESLQETDVSVELPTPTEIQPYPPPVENTPDVTPQPYPPPVGDVLNPTSQADDPYPPPVENDNPYPIDTQPSGNAVTLTPTQVIARTPTPTRTPSQPTATPQPTTTRGLIPPMVTPVAGLSGLVTVWHSWGSIELQAFIQVIDAYQDINPDVRFDLSYVPLDELKAKYEADAYRGKGPSVLVGPSDWIASLASHEVVEDLTSQLPASLTSRITSPALDAGSYQSVQPCLPFAMKGMLLYRNSRVITSPAATFDELILNAQRATKAGVVGAYLERGSYYSAAHLSGLGGSLLDSNGYPAFNADNFRLALDWVELLRKFELAGATEFYGNRDLTAFKEGRIGYIFEGSWRLNELVEAVGKDNLVVDPWPVYQSGSLSGYVQPSCLFLNVNTHIVSEADFQASIQFMRFVLQKDVQSFIAEAGLIPAAKDAVVKNLFIQQAITAFQRGSPYPAYLVDSYGSAYWDSLDAALLEIFQGGVDPKTALFTAYLTIRDRLAELNNQ